MSLVSFCPPAARSPSLVPLHCTLSRPPTLSAGSAGQRSSAASCQQLPLYFPPLSPRPHCTLRLDRFAHAPAPCRRPQTPQQLRQILQTQTQPSVRRLRLRLPPRVRAQSLAALPGSCDSAPGFGAQPPVSNHNFLDNSQIFSQSFLIDAGTLHSARSALQATRVPWAGSMILPSLSRLMSFRILPVSTASSCSC